MEKIEENEKPGQKSYIAIDMTAMKAEPKVSKSSSIHPVYLLTMLYREYWFKDTILERAGQECKMVKRLRNKKSVKNQRDSRRGMYKR